MYAHSLNWPVASSNTANTTKLMMDKLIRMGVLKSIQSITDAADSGWGESEIGIGCTTENSIDRKLSIGSLPNLEDFKTAPRTGINT